MTINYLCVSDNERRSRLPFGVPLEDIFPHNDIHPYLKRIFIKAYQDICSYGYSIEEIITKFQGSIADRLILKEIVAQCESMPGVVPPGALLWILRHFIGLLPLPLLPNYTDKRYFSWKRLSQFCKRSFIKYATIEVNKRLLTQKLANELSQLPPPNLLLFSILVNFIRLLSYQQLNHCKRFNKLAAFCLVRYFSSSIFIRPFTPARNSTIDRHYLPLLFYLVLKWPNIEKYFKVNLNATVELTEIPKELLNTKDYLYSSSAKVRIRNAHTQTHEYESDCRCLDTISEVSVEECDFLRDTACQTDDFTRKSEGMRCCCSYGSNYESSLNEHDPNDKASQTNFTDASLSDKSVGNHESKRDVSVSTEYASRCDDHGEKSTETRLKVDADTSTGDLPYYGWVNPGASSKTTDNLDVSSPKTFITDSEYIYDDYTGSTLNLLGNIEETQSNEEDLLTRISKIGWTYTPPRSTNSPLISPVTSSKTALKEKNYTLCYSEKEHLNKEEKENCSSCESLKSKRSFRYVPSARSRKSFSLANIKSKLDFFKIFSGKRETLKNSCSYEEISDIKYKKMNSVKSTLF